MSTVTPPTPGLGTTKRDELHRRVTDPLERVRGYIRFYVSVHGVLLVLIYLALCFWIGLALDFGFFKLFTWDWVQVLPGKLRGAILAVGGIVLAAVLLYKVVYRLVRDFRDPAVALVLERRFPHLLGDRLITAVELADPREAARCGYSQAMIDRTIEEAAERVGQVPIRDAFNWKRLNYYVGTVVLLTLGMYLVACAVYFIAGSITNARRSADKKPTTPLNAGNFFSEFNNVSARWFERNILVRDVIWPRRVHLELVGFPEDDPKTGKKGMRVGKNVAAAPLRVRAIKWVRADAAAPEGWRPLRWNDLNTRLLNREVPELPPEWQLPADVTVDQVEMRLDKDKDELGKVSSKLKAEDLLQRRGLHERFDVIMGGLARVGTDPKMARKLRMLEVPDQVVVTYHGEQTRGEMTFKREDNYEYSGSFTDLKETILFEVSAEDYSTRSKQITVVPPPVLKSLMREDAHPAYVYQVPPTDNDVPRSAFLASVVGLVRSPLAPGGLLAASTALPDRLDPVLRGLKQALTPELTQLSGDKSILILPRGSDIKLTGVIDDIKDPEGKIKELSDVTLVARNEATGGKTDAKRPEPPTLPTPVLLEDKRTFVVFFKNVTRPLTFDLKFTDSDGVPSHRQIIIDPLPDAPPKLKVAVESVIRKTPEGYKITPSALVPFTGSAEDDRGLARLEFYASHTRSETSGVAEERAKVAAHVLSLTPSSCTAMPLLGTPLIPYIVKKLPTAETGTRSFMLPLFQTKMDEQMKKAVSTQALERRLHQPLPREHLYNVHRFDQNLELFDIAKNLPDLKAPDNAIQPPHRLEVWLVATDTNVEYDRDKGPGVTESDDHFNFIIVSEGDLMADIKGEEDKLKETLKKVQKTVEDARKGANGLDTSVSYLTASDFDPKSGFPNEVTRIDRIKESVKSQRDVTEGIAKEYRRLQQEMEYNRFRAKDIEQLRKISDLLNGMIHKEFENVDKALERFKTALENNKYDPELAVKSGIALDELLARLEEVMQEIGTLLTEQELIQRVQELHKIELESRKRIEEIKRLLED